MQDTTHYYTYNEEGAIARAADVLTDTNWAESSEYIEDERKALEGMLKRLFALPSVENIRDVVREELEKLVPYQVPGTIAVRDDDFIKVLFAAWKCDHETIPSDRILKALLVRDRTRHSLDMEPIRYEKVITEGRYYQTFDDFLHEEELTLQLIEWQKESQGSTETIAERFLEHIQADWEEHDVVFMKENDKVTEILYW